MKRRNLLLASGVGFAHLAHMGQAQAASTHVQAASPHTQTAARDAKPRGRLIAWQQHWQEQLAAIEQSCGGRLGVSMLDTATGVTLGWRAQERFAMCSTFKMLLAAWMLALVDQGQESLTQRIHYGASDVVTYSPISGPHADKDGMTVAELCAATVSWSDNTAANVLMQRHGGPEALTAFLRTQGDAITRLDRYELELNAVEPGDTRDTTTPWAMMQTTRRFVLGNALSVDSRAFLRHWLRDCRTGDKRLRAGAPGWIVGDKTGTWEKDGIANDVAVLWPQDSKGAPLVIACYLAQVKGEGANRDAVVATVARTLLDARAALKAA